MSGPWEDFTNASGPWDDYKAPAARQSAAPKAKPSSFWQGVEVGIRKPLDNAATMASNVLHHVPVSPLWELLSKSSPTIGGAIDKAGAALGLPTIDQSKQQFQQRQAAKPTRPSGVGQFVGNVLGTAPTMMIPGGVLAQGAASGALLTDKPNDIGQVAQDAALGAGGAYAGGKLLKAAGRVVAPKISKALTAMNEAGVVPSPGKALRAGGGFVRNVIGNAEERASSLPITGTMINNSQRRSIDQFNRAPLQKALGFIREQLPKDVATGHDAIAHTQNALGDFYDATLAKMQIVPDEQMGADMQAILHGAQNGGLDAPHLDSLHKVIQNQIVRRFSNGTLQGDALQSALSEIKTKAANYGSSSVASEREFGNVLGDLHDALEGAAARSSDPVAAADLKAANAGYAHLVRAEGAAKMAPDGIYTPGQLNTAIRTADKSVRKRAIAAGKGLMQDYAKAGVEVLGNKLPDSGTAARSMTWNPVPWVVGAAGAIPYKAAQLTVPLLNRPPGPVAAAAGKGLTALGPYAGLTIPPLLLAPPSQ